MKRPDPHDIARMARRLADQRRADRATSADAALRLLEAGFRGKAIEECLDAAMRLSGVFDGTAFEPGRLQ